MCKVDKKISPREFYKRMRALRDRPHRVELIEKFNRLMENSKNCLQALQKENLQPLRDQRSSKKK